MSSHEIEGRVYHEVVDTRGGNYTYAYQLDNEDVESFVERILRSNEGKLLRITIEELGEKMCEECGENEAEKYSSTCQTCQNKENEEEDSEE